MSRGNVKTTWTFANGTTVQTGGETEKSKLFEKMVSALDEKDLAVMRYHIQQRERQLAALPISPWKPPVGDDIRL